MDKIQLEKQLFLPLTKLKMVKLAELCKREQSVVPVLLEISSFHKEPKIAFRAAWVLEYILFSSFPSADDQLLFFNYYPLQKHNSCRRHYTKLLLLLIRKGHPPTGSSLSAIINQTSEWLIERKIPVAVKANCIEILYYLRNEEDWIEGELKLQIELLMKSGSAALQSRGKKYLILLNQE
ncbi:hypothetical protein [Arcticibacter svalbardensis]|nr:hypothetical protein [Arcticibacter svalbardensis]